MTPPDPPSTAERLIRGRRAVRAYRPDPVPDTVITAIFDLAAAAPSNGNTQPWSVDVVSAGARERLGEALVRAAEEGKQTPDFPVRPYTGVAAERCAAAGALMYGALGVARGDHAGRRRAFLAGLRFYGAPHVALLSLPADADERMAADLGIYAQTLMLAMTAYGVASCPQGVLGLFADAVRSVLGPTTDKLLFGVSFGYAEPKAMRAMPVVPRVPLAETTRFHR
ncbi:nitroreductase [Streptomyces mobaraensis NBRC 13819 = DSM 40847]|uniref:Oxidoreductase n=2 Tax=Streptomyces mobaraensis TaxID=35621 RepID=A0A5N5W9M5_STRMB|nr:nitroreductase [Streptomyces mobaraensis]EMF01215.1 oxidoreductase [Streptomyces mobaraensis NBRC 13819 = DSM 40847]KAB7846928.1 oxidoreductase [Streptomyces mobaraensis]QTT76639.1 nitroreductase [Streptomyces mobaraensis NBRC 13819 = DSM 40847]